MSKGYEKNYLGIVHKLADCDFTEAAARLGLAPPVNGVVKISFLGRDYEINSTGVTVTDGSPVHPNYLSILVFYITSKGRAEPEGAYNSLHSFVSPPAGAGDISWLTSTPLSDEFGKDYARFNDTMKSLGAVNEESAKGKHTWIYRVLPKIPMKIVYLEADEEFPCEVKLQLDNCAKKFLEFEQLAFLCGCFVTTMVKKPASEFVTD